MKQLVLDAGPLIALFYRQDTDHTASVAGFTQLTTANVILLTPIPVVFEVYKWLLQRTYPQIAQHTLQVMKESLHFIPLEAQDFEEIQGMVFQLSEWQGSLEDSTVVYTALRYRSPVWTLNYRDFAQFNELEFWTPDLTTND